MSLLNFNQIRDEAWAAAPKNPYGGVDMDDLAREIAERLDGSHERKRILTKFLMEFEQLLEPEDRSQ